MKFIDLAIYSQHKKLSFPLRISSVNVNKSTENFLETDLVTFTEEILTGKLRFLCCDRFTMKYANSRIFLRNKYKVTINITVFSGILEVKMKNYKSLTPIFECLSSQKISEKSIELNYFKNLIFGPKNIAYNWIWPTFGFSLKNQAVNFTHFSMPVICYNLEKPNEHV